MRVAGSSRFLNLSESEICLIMNPWLWLSRQVIKVECHRHARAATPLGTHDKGLLRLFEENKELLALFTKFSELHTAEHQLSSTELAEHASKVMHTLDEGVKALRDVDGFMTYVRHVGATHHQVDGFQASNFWKIEQPFLEAAKTTLGERYTPNIENIYKLTIRFILENLVKGYEDAAPSKGQTEIDLNK
ncbi:hypothetical protein MSG28_004824 [Choristoneura fumiferana]|uniref:Uncharacterized protein n=1 Tax=Choristoneura fumiferana TaxID=7141 RepID=A0ACC0K849_CHOFU|nr:hypothetical protein MSG28_004824 [Choristoneura fumiferana]